MPAGCEFICKNKSCAQCGNGFIITAPWPMGQIELVVNSILVKNNNELRQKLLDFKKEGRKFACIQMPDSEYIPVIAYRVQLWSPEASCLWQYDLELNDKSLHETLQDDTLPKKCEKTGCDLLDFSEVIEQGVKCPTCKEIMYQNRWYSNEH